MNTTIESRSESIWMKAQCFASEFRRLVRRYVPSHESVEYHELLPQMQDAASCYSPAVWSVLYKPKTPKEIVMHVHHAGEKAAGLRGFSDTIHVRCESGDFGGTPDFEDFIQGAVSEWYDGAKVSVASVHQAEDTHRIDVLEGLVKWMLHLREQGSALAGWDAQARQALEGRKPLDLQRVLRLVDKVANLNPDAGEIGAGMLNQLVTEAKEIQR